MDGEMCLVPFVKRQGAEIRGQGSSFTREWLGVGGEGKQPFFSFTGSR